MTNDATAACVVAIFVKDAKIGTALLIIARPTRWRMRSLIYTNRVTEKNAVLTFKAPALPKITYDRGRRRPHRWVATMALPVGRYVRFVQQRALSADPGLGTTHVIAEGRNQSVSDKGVRRITVDGTDLDRS